MKKLFTLLYVALIALGVSFNAAAQDTYTMTITWDTPGAVRIQVNTVPVDIPEGATSYTVTTTDKWASTAVLPADGYLLDTATGISRSDGTTATVSVNNGTKAYFSVSSYSSATVTTRKDIPDASVTVNIINGAADIVSISLNPSGKTLSNLKNGTFTIDYNSAIDTQLTITPRNNFEPYSITLNGTAVEKRFSWDNFYRVDIQNGDVITIRGYEDDEPAPDTFDVTLSYTNAGAECIASIRNNSNLTTITPVDNKFTVESVNGSVVLRITIAEDYTLQSYTVNGETTTASSDQDAFTVIVTKDTAIEINASKKSYYDITFTAYITNPEGITLYAGNRLTGYQIDLGEGEPITSDISLPSSDVDTDGAYTMSTANTRKYTFSISSKYGTINYYTNGGYWLRAARMRSTNKHADNPMSSSDCSTFYLVALPILNDTEAIVYVAGDPDKIKLMSSPIHGAGDIKLTESGYNTIEFDSAYQNPFSMNYSGEKPDNFAIYLDGVAMSPDENGVYQDINILQNSVVKVFADGKIHPKRTITFDAAAGATATVTYDKVLTYTDLATPLSVFDGTEVCITPAEGTAVTITGAEATLADGTYTFTATKNTTVTLKGDITAVILDPVDGSTVESLEHIYISFPDATTAARNTALDDDEITLIGAGNSWGYISLTITEVADAEVPTFDICFYPAPTLAIDYTLYIAPEFFTLDGDIPSKEVQAVYTLEKNTSELPYMVMPESKILLAEWMNFGFMFEEGHMITVADASKVKVTLAGQTLAASDYMLMCEGNSIVVAITNAAVLAEGTLTFDAQEGAFTISGTPSPAIKYSWTAVMPKEYNCVITTASGSTGSTGSIATDDLSYIILSFEGAETVEIFNENGAELWDGTYSASSYRQTAKIEIVTPEIVTFAADATPVAEAKLIFDPAPQKNGNYQLTVNYGTFVLDGVQDNDRMSATYAFTSGIYDIIADSAADGAIYNLQGVKLEAEWSELPAGLYIKAGKVVLKK